MVKSYFPSTQNEALEIAAKHKVIPMAGGTDLLIRYRNWSGLTPTFDADVLFIDQIEELKTIEAKKDGQVYIGAGAVLSDIINFPGIFEILRLSLIEIAAPGLRNRATLAGNICNASPAGDALPALYVLNAKVELTSVHSTRNVPIEDFITGPGTNILNQDELLTGIIIPNTSHNIVYYRKVGTRKANALSKLSIAGIANIQNNKVKSFSVALGAVAPTIVRDRDIEKEMADQKVELVDNQKICRLYDPLIVPINDQRSTAEYRKTVALNLINDFLSRIKTH